MNLYDNQWPHARTETRPWTRWWWHGSAVDKTTITRLLETYREAGLGGVELTCIYGVKGQKSNNIEYLSPQCKEMVEYTIAEAKRMGMSVDMPPGSGWRIGGDFITDSVAAAQLKIEKPDEDSPARLEVKSLPEKVKRAGHGGHGRTFNPFSRASLQAVIEHFEPVFKDLDIRAQFHDSWEYDSSACPELFDRFREKRGYELQEYAEVLAGDGSSSETRSRVRYDIQITLAELALEEFIVPWTEWCRELGQLSRNQAHGSPGNLLDLYAASDIPETEVFRSITPDTPLVSKFASSAAHVAGRPLISSETGTWLREHFHVTLADLKMLCDNLFVAGINHHVYHGTAYSPPDAQWPGWLFYASAQLNPQNPIWRDFPKLNEYVTRCQSILQDGEPDNDLLVYFPLHDILSDPDHELAGKLHIKGDWLEKMPATETFRKLWDRGYSFDYISDRQIAELRVEQGNLATTGGHYSALVVPPCDYIPVETLETLQSLPQKGANIIFASPLPADVPGLSRLDERRKRFEHAMGNISGAENLEIDLESLGIGREKLAGHHGLHFIRRRHPSGYYYFLSNESEHFLDEYVTLAVDFADVLVMEPMTGETGTAQVRRGESPEIRIQLDPGASLILRTSNQENEEPVGWQYLEAPRRSYELRGKWQVEFIEGGPQLPPAYETQTLASWTEHGGVFASFAGTARYRLEFDAPKNPTEIQALDLGEVHSSARVRVNGGEWTTLIGPTFRTRISNIEPNGNVLEVEVTNLAANRIRDLDRRGVEWRIFEDINFASRDYGTFDASNWPIMSSGLLGPVTLII